MALETALVAAQPLLDALRRLVGAGVGVSGERLGLQHDAGIEMDHALGAKTESFLGNHYMTGKSAVEIFAGRLGDARADARAQGLADVDVLTRYAKRHGGSPL